MLRIILDADARGQADNFSKLQAFSTFISAATMAPHRRHGDLQSTVPPPYRFHRICLCIRSTIRLSSAIRTKQALMKSGHFGSSGIATLNPSLFTRRPSRRGRLATARPPSEGLDSARTLIKLCIVLALAILHPPSASPTGSVYLPRHSRSLLCTTHSSEHWHTPLAKLLNACY